MSTPLLCPRRFADIEFSLCRHGLDGLTPRGCPSLVGELHRAVNLEPFAENADQAYRDAVCALVFDWRRANAAAHAARYAGHADTPDLAPALPRGCLLSPPALLKALRCLRYNCDDGAGIGAALQPSLDVLDRLIDALKDHCLELLPEYRGAAWF